MKKFCEIIRQHVMKINNFKKKEMNDKTAERVI